MGEGSIHGPSLLTVVGMIWLILTMAEMTAKTPRKATESSAIFCFLGMFKGTNERRLVEFN
jgi:hypothetical protein